MASGRGGACTVWGCVVQREQGEILEDFQDFPRGVALNRDGAVNVGCAQGLPRGSGVPTNPSPSLHTLSLWV